MTRIALFGVSGYGKCLLEAIRQVETNGDCRIEAACIINRSQEEQIWQQLSNQGVCCFDDAQSLWKEMSGRIDLTILPTPPQTHCEYTLQAFSSGSHVLVEKPISTNVPDAQRMARGAELAGRQLYVGFQDGYTPSTQTLKRLLVNEIYGKLLSVSFLGLWPRELGYYSRNSWAGKSSHQGKTINDNPVSNAFAHFLNLSLFFAGSSQEESACVVDLEAELFRANAIETFDTAAMRMQSDQGIPIHFYCSHSTEFPRTPVIKIETENSILEWRYEDGLYLMGSEESLLFTLPSREESRVTMINNVISRIQGSEVPVCTTERAIQCVSITEQLSKLPVQQITSSHLSKHKISDDVLLAVPGLSEKLGECYEKGLLPSELPCSQADEISISLQKF